MRYAALIVAATLAGQAGAAGPAAQISIDARRAVRELPRFALYPNTSLRYAPPHELAAIVEKEYGRPRITRCWLPLDDMWDYRDDSYHFNFQLGYDRYASDTVKHKYDRGIITAMNLHYYDHLAAFSRHSDDILLNVRRYEHEVTRGIITMAKWKEVVKTGLRHYKQRYPNLRYIEALNEYHIVSFGGLKDDQYYDFYRTMYQIVNELNDELKPKIPLLVGGPNVVGPPFSAEDPKKAPGRGGQGQRMYRFFQNYAADPDPRKRLDFVSFHDYALAANPAAIERYESLIKSWLRENGLRDDMPFFETEIGYAGPKPNPELNQNQATGVSAFFYWTRGAKQHILFPWVLFHEPERQRSLSAFTPDLKMAPFGAALKMWALQKKNEVSVEWTGQPPRAYAIATVDGSGMAVEVWNDAAQPMSAEVVLASLPASLAGKVRVREYRIDSKNSNPLLAPAAQGRLDMLREEGAARAPRKWTVDLEPYSLALWTIEPQPRKTR